MLRRTGEVGKVIRDLRALGYEQVRQGKHVLMQKGTDRFVLPQGSSFSQHWRNETLMRIRRLQAEDFNQRTAKRREEAMVETGFSNTPKVVVNAPVTAKAVQTWAEAKVEETQNKPNPFHAGLTRPEVGRIALVLKDKGASLKEITRLVLESGFKKTRNEGPVDVNYVQILISKTRVELKKGKQAPKAEPKVFASRVEAPEAPRAETKTKASKIIQMIADICLSNLDEETKISLIADKAKAL